MHFEHSEKVRVLIHELESFMDRYIYPNEKPYLEWVTDRAKLWQPWPGLDELKARARAAGLWNLFLPKDYGDFSPGLSILEYAPLAEIMGHSHWSSQVFNCSAPDTGNMEVLARYGTPEQQQQWLIPLLAGEIRSAFAMTEPQVASSDATNLETTILADGDDYIINGRKWWISGAMDPRCRFLLVMGKTRPDAPVHRQQSTIIVPMGTPGVTLVRALPMFGSLNSPAGQAELLFHNVRVPKANLILGEGRGFEIAQGRLGPGRIHHCMRLIGQAQRALELMAQRAAMRVAFGRKLADQSSVRQAVARSFCEIEQARLLTLKAADAVDRYGAKKAQALIGAVKIVAPQMAQTVIDRAIQIHGGMGVSDDTPLASYFALARTVRIVDGPDEVHLSQVGKLKINEYSATANQAG